MLVDLASKQHASRRRPAWIGRAEVAAALVAALACAKLATAGSSAPEVAVVTVQPAPASLTREVPGRAAPYRTAEVRARVSGIVQKRLFAEGAEVKEGQLLFRIDPARHEEAYESARAKLAQAEARVASARLLLTERLEEPASSEEAGRQDRDDAAASLREAEADLAAARAAAATACINLGYTAVTAPLAGRIGRATVAEGAYAQQGQATLLAIVQQLDPMYVEATLSSTDAARLRADLAAERLPRTDSGAVRVMLVLENGSEYREPGTVQLSDVSVDPGTGSVAVRAVFPNPRRELVPGASVRARVAEVVAPSAVLVPQSAVRPDAGGGGTVVLVVDAADRVAARAVEIGGSAGDDWVVAAGLRAGERVVAHGLPKIRPGMKVRPVRAP
jgi:membrane fusion protein (multidrug efflux system)